MSHNGLRLCSTLNTKITYKKKKKKYQERTQKPALVNFFWQLLPGFHEKKPVQVEIYQKHVTKISILYLSLSIKQKKFFLSRNFNLYVTGSSSSSEKL